MSEPIPESIPTSSDPRSKRPTKRRAVTPRSTHASQIEALFAAPNRATTILDTLSSTTKSSGTTLPPPPELVPNVQGSSAGAGSGEFHVYKASRRREYERLRAMEEEVRQEEEEEAWARERREKESREEERREKRRGRREKARVRREKAKQGGKREGEEGKKKLVPRVDRAGGLGRDGEVIEEQGEGGEVKNANVSLEEVGLVIEDDD